VRRRLVIAVLVVASMLAFGGAIVLADVPTAQSP